MQFTGWVPTITGRMSFSRVGGDYGNHRATICNRSAYGFLFGVEHRQSRDAPIPDLLLRPFGRIRGIHAFAFLRLGSTMLPVPSDNPTTPIWKEDKQGELCGTVIVTAATWRDKPAPHVFARQFRERARAGSNPEISATEVVRQGTEAEQSLSDFWAALVSSYSQNPAKVPAFARATVRLKRTGICEIEVYVGDLFHSEPILKLRRSGLSPAQIEQKPEAEAAASQIARHVFFFMRDLAHRHYHHQPHSDLATTVYRSGSGNDEQWRRETQYSLVRMAISARRENRIESYRQAQGIIAYAEAFQRHLATWKEVRPQETDECAQVFPYDFDALKGSMEASLAGRDEAEARRREATIYFVGSLLAILGAILGSGQIWSANTAFSVCKDTLCRVDGAFWIATHNIVLYPWYWLAGGITLSTVFLVGTGRVLSGHSLSISIRSGVGRALDAWMGTFTTLTRSRFVSWALAIGLSSAIIFGASGYFVLHFAQNAVYQFAVFLQYYLRR